MYNSNAMNDFTIGVVLNNYSFSEQLGQDIFSPSVQIITDFKNGVSSNFSTYDENLQLSDNSSSTFSFKIMFKNKGKTNPFLSLLSIGREICLYWENKYYYFVITNKTPDFKENNIEFSFSCQDSLSYYLSHSNISATFKDDPDSKKFKYTGKNIKELMMAVLEQGGVSKRWIIDPTLAADIRPSFPDNLGSSQNNLIEATASLNLTNSNTFNALIEIVKIFNGSLRVIYNKDPKGPHIITVLNKDFPNKTYHRLSLTTNLNSFNINEEGKEFCSILYVKGGSDSNGQKIGLLPPMPHNIIEVYGWLFQNKDKEKDKDLLSKKIGSREHLEAFKQGTGKNINFTLEDWDFCSIINNNILSGESMLYDFSYFLESNQMPKFVYDRINRILSTDYRNSNLKIKLYTEYYYNLLRDYQRAIDKEREIVNLLTASYQEKLNSYIDNSYKENVKITPNNENLILMSKDVSDLNISIYSQIQEKKKDLEDASGENKEQIQAEINELTSLLSIKKEDEIDSNINNLYTNLLNVWADNYIEPRFQMGFIEKEEKEYDEIHFETFMQKEIFNYRKSWDSVIEEYEKIYNDLNKIVKDKNIPTIDQDGVLHYNIITEVDERVSKLQIENKGAYADYCALKNKLKELSKFLNKIVVINEEEKFLLGYYHLYISVLNNLQTIYDSLVIENYQPPFGMEDFLALELVQTIKTQMNAFKDERTGVNFLTLLKESKEEKDNIWNYLVSTYSQYFIEGNFEDNNQLDSKALYKKAMGQFINYSKPILQYSASMLDWDNFLQSNVVAPQIGDALTFTYENVNLYNNTEDKNTIVVQFLTRKPVYLIQKINGIFIKDLLNTEKHPTSFNNIRVIKTYSVNGKFYTDVEFIVNKNYSNLVDFNFILTLNDEKVYDNKILKDEESIVLAITGLSKKLRENTTQLTVSNTYAMSTVIQKILLGVR